MLQTQMNKYHKGSLSRGIMETVKFHGFLQVQRARGPNVLACAECWVPNSPVVIVLGKGITCDCTHLTALVVGNLHPAFSSCRGGNRRREVANAFAHARVVHIPCDDRSSELLPGCWAVDHSGPGSRGTNRAEVARGHLSHASTGGACATGGEARFGDGDRRRGGVGARGWRTGFALVRTAGAEIRSVAS